MTRATFFKHFDLLADQPDAVAKMRELVLELAVRGNLVPQNPKDEPADKLLARLRAKNCPEGMADADLNNGSNKPLNLPRGWTWARFPELGKFSRGKSRHRPRNEPSLYTDGKYPLVQTGDVARAKGIISTHTGLYNEKGLAQSKLWPVGTMCITIAANIAETGILGMEACIPDSVVGFIPDAEFVGADYFEFFMRTAKARLQDFAPSTAQKNINMGILESVYIPLPPLAEQRRIVVKVDELMSLCDELAAQQQSSRDAETLFHRSALHHLVTARDSAALAVGWQRVSNHFHSLHDSPDSIAQLRQAILQLAVHGRLDGQSDSGWRQVRLDELGNWALGCGFPTAEQGHTNKPILFAKVSDMNLPGNEKFLTTANNTIDEAAAKRLRVKIHPAGTVVFPKIGGAIATNKRRLVVRPTAIDNNCLGIIPSGAVNPNWLYLLLTSMDFAQYQSGTSVPALNQSTLGEIPVLLPPLAEQQRIVKRVTELMRQCDILEAQLNDSRTLGTQLLDSTIHHLFTAKP